MISLRPYQQNGTGGIRESFLKGNKRVLYVLATGGGKTETFIWMAEQAIQKGKTVFFLVHKKNLVRQISERCKKYGLRHGIISGGSRKQYYLNAQICSVQTLKNRLEEVPVPDFIIVDEAHHSNAGTWKDILDYYSEVYTLGVTATPIRTDGQGLGDIYNDMILGPAPAELVKLGNLVMPEYYNFRPIEGLEKVKRDKFGDYDLKELFEVMDKPKITGDIVIEYQRLASGEPAIYSCINIRHAENIAQAFRDAGYTSEAVHGKLDEYEIDRIFKGLADRSINVVTFCDLISEGTDIPAVAVVGLLRRTMSLSLYLQIVGRGLRPCEGKDKCLILDHVGNKKLHGHPLMTRDWTLEGNKKKKRKKDEDEEKPDDGYTDCIECLRTYEKTEPKCPYCGAEPVNKPREMEQVKGIAVKDETTLDELLQKKEQRIQQGRSKTLEDLYNLGKNRGYKDKWAYYIFESRVLKDKGTLSEINSKFGISADSTSEHDLKAAVLKEWNNFKKNITLVIK